MHHNWNHILRDLVRGIVIGKEEEVNIKIILAGILLHDIGRIYPAISEEHYLVDTEVSTEYLRKTGFHEEEIKKVVHCIKSHSPRGLEEPQTSEVKV